MSLVQIRFPGSGGADEPKHPVDGLLDCHARIHEFTELSLKLSQGAWEPAAASDAARAIRRYFSEALPLHELDEDLSLAPQLRAANAPDTVLQALDVVTRQHPDIDRVVGRMFPLWQAIEEDGTRLPSLAEQLGRATERLSVIWDPHLSLEESEIFPAARALLSPQVVETIRREMHERRSLPPPLP